MPSSSTEMRDLLGAHNFKALFTRHLGWDNYSATQSLAVEGKPYRLEAVAIKGGLPVFVCRVADLAALERKTALDLDNLLAKAAAEHIIVFHDDKSQLWQFSKREIGKANRFNRTAPLPNSHSFTDLLARLSGLKVSLEQEIAAQERGGFGIIEIAGRINRNFNVDSVSAKFYTGFKTQRDSLLTFLDGVEGRVKDEYASLLLTRLMFLYFMQSKRFLVGDTGYLRTAFEDKTRRFDGKSDYYSGFLCPLFFEMLSKKPDDRCLNDTPRFREAKRVFGDLIYLNGGLFAPRDFELTDKIGVRDEFFDGLFEFFDSWNWVLDDRPTRDGREINPDVLGYVFEKFINQKQMGAYYTKEDITGYIARNTILPFLFEKAAPSPARAFGLISANPARYIYPAVKHGIELDLPADIEAGIADVSKRTEWNRSATPDLGLPTEIWREVVARRARCQALMGAGTVASGESDADTTASTGGTTSAEGVQFTQIADLITHNLNIELWMADVIANLETQDEVFALWGALESVSILDPTVGSGAFLFAAMGILEPLYRELLARMDEVVEDFDERRAKHSHLLRGRTDDFRAIIEDIEKHRSRPYEIFKKMMVRNLFGVDIMGEAVEICKLRLFLKLASQATPDPKQPNLGIEPLPDIDFNIRAGNTLVGFASLPEVESAAKVQMNFGIDWAEVEGEMRSYGAAFDQFHELQRHDGTAPPHVKAALQLQHDTLVEKLNWFSAGQYQKMPKSDPKGYAAWKASHQPFHWCAEFYSILQNGGFDVIIGNPPYVEYSKVRDDYTIKGYETESCGNLYAFVMERCFLIASQNAKTGMIVQLSAICTDRMQPLQQQILEHSRETWSSCFDDRPGKLFDGLEHIRAAVILNAVGKVENKPKNYSTNLLRWPTATRDTLFALLNYNPIGGLEIAGSFPKAGVERLRDILERVRGIKQTLAVHNRSKSEHIVYYYRSPLYWIRSMDFLPHFESEGANRSIHHFKDFGLISPEMLPVVGCIVNSTLFYLWFITYGNGRNVALRDITTFPIPDSLAKDAATFKCAFTRLMEDYKTNSITRKRKDGVQFQEFYPSKSKLIIDEIDRVLAAHYGFSAEELDFIINYDIKYRMGQGAGDE